MNPLRFHPVAPVLILAVLAMLLPSCEREKPAAQPQPEPSAAATSAAEPATAPPPAPVPVPAPHAAAPGSAAIKLHLPDPFVSARPFRGKVANLEAGDSSPVVAEFHAPAGTQVVSERKPVSASASPLQGRLAMLTDGDNSSYPDALLVLPGGGQWAQIDLGNSVAIQKVHVWHAQNLGSDVYVDLIVQASDDPQFQKDVVTLYNADADGSLGLGAGADKAYVETHQGRLIDGKGQKARYVRIWGAGSYSDKRLRFAEVQVYATP